LQNKGSMKVKIRACVLLPAFLTMVISLPVHSRGRAPLLQKQATPGAVSRDEKRTIKAFEKRVKAYVKLRDRAKAKVPKISKDSTPEQIAAHEKGFADALRVARADAKPGELFSAGIAAYLRRTLKNEFQGTDEKEIRKILLDDETKPVPVRVNYPYPEANAFTEMPATLLLKLPQLPKEVKYRYVRRNLFLVDTDNNLIIDYMVDALP
jgi:hypothetical protein